jgi:type IV secretion system protein VirB10
MQAGLSGQNGDPNMQSAKDSFFNQDIKDLGYLPNKVVPQLSRYELKRGSVIPATLITGISSDLPGRITAQTSQNVYDSAPGHQLLVPQGAKLFGRYDHKISFGQSRVLVVWTDIIFPNGSTLQLGGMAGPTLKAMAAFGTKSTGITFKRSVRRFSSLLSAQGSIWPCRRVRRRIPPRTLPGGISRTFSDG